MLIEICLSLIPEIKLIPFVISKIPVENATEIVVGKFNFLQIGSKIKEIIFAKPLVFSIEIITEKSTTKPPIKSVVDIADVILSPKTSPRLEKEMFCNLFSDTEALYIFSCLTSFFQNLNKNPTVKQPKM